jgi:serine/threonine protein kinase
MPQPTTTDALLDMVRKSGLVDAARLQRAVAAGPCACPDAMLARLTADGLLTPFQAERIAVGKYKGFLVGDYRLLDKIGSGGMGTVYVAEPAAGGPRVAVKILGYGLAHDPVARERFAREGRAAAGLAHPNLVPVREVRPDAEPPFLVMEYVDGVTLQAAVAKSGTFAVGAAAHCGVQAARGLQAAADAGLVHRDVKPANLIVARDGTVKLLDLGIVRVENGGDLTRKFDPGAVLGTADYVAPEQVVDSSTVDARADIYSLGATLYFLLAGHPPYPGGSSDEKMVLKQTTDPERIDRVRPDVPAGLADVVHGMLARRPEDRPAAPAAAGRQLARWADPGADFPAGLFAPHAPPAPGPATADLNRAGATERLAGLSGMTR